LKVFTGDLATPTLLSFPEPPSNIVSFASGFHHSLALMRDVSWYSWGKIPRANSGDSSGNKQHQKNGKEVEGVPARLNK
jgi:alpha-tubulin suppressor-like RCC1 family protein